MIGYHWSNKAFVPIHAHTQSYGQFRVINELNMHVFGMWEEVGECANSTQKGPSQDLIREPPCCEVTVLTTTPHFKVNVDNYSLG